MAITVFLVLIFNSIGKAQEDFPAKIDQAIERGVAWLKQRQVKDGPGKGSWGGASGTTYDKKTTGHENKIGIAAFSLYALLACGVPSDDQAIKDGFNFIQKNIRGLNATTYERAALLMALEALADAVYNKQHSPAKGDYYKQKPKAMRQFLNPEQTQLAEEQVQWLEKAQTKQGGWRYGTGFPMPGGMKEDISAAQFVLLGLKAAVRLGIGVRKETFANVLKYNLEEQEKDGPAIGEDKMGTDRGVLKETKTLRETKARGWAYSKASQTAAEKTTAGSMTAAAISSLILCKSELMKTTYLNKKLEAELDQSIYDGVAWLVQNYTVKTNPKMPDNLRYYYYLYGLERVGVLGGFTCFGDHNWYNDGAQLLIDQQTKDGYWDTKKEVAPSDVTDTDYALLFLKKATKPVIAIETIDKK